MSDLNGQHLKVLSWLGKHTTEDFLCCPFAPIMRDTKLTRAQVRRSCRFLARKSLARYERALWTEDGEPAGAGYGITKAGSEFLEARGEP